MAGAARAHRRVTTDRPTRPAAVGRGRGAGRMTDAPLRPARGPTPAYAGTIALIDARTISSTRSICCSVMTRGGEKKICSATEPSGTG